MTGTQPGQRPTTTGSDTSKDVDAAIQRAYRDGQLAMCINLIAAISIGAVVLYWLDPLVRVVISSWGM